MKLKVGKALLVVNIVNVDRSCKVDMIDNLADQNDNHGKVPVSSTRSLPP